MNVYKIINKVNDKVYIGQTKHSVEKRFKSHLAASRFPLKEEYNYYLKRAIRKYGENNFECVLVDAATTPEELNRKEMDWIEKCKSYLPEFGYNDTRGGDNYNWKRSKKTIAKMIQTRKLNIMARENGCFGVFWDDERNSFRYEINRNNKLMEIRRGYQNQEDCALARDIALVKFIEDEEECKMYMNFPDSYVEIKSGEIKLPPRIMKRALKISKYKWVNFEPAVNQWVAKIKKNGKLISRSGMFSTEEEAAIVADFLNVGLGNDISFLNFPERLEEYKNKDFKLPQTALLKRKTSQHRYVTKQKSGRGKVIWAVDVRLLKIRGAFKTEEEAIAWRNEKMKEVGVKIPD